MDYIEQGTQVEWNAGINPHTGNEMWRGPYDFGWYTKDNGVLLYEEGCRNMQDSFIVPLSSIRIYG